MTNQFGYRSHRDIVIQPERISLAAMVLLVDGFLPLIEETFLNFLDPLIDSDTESSDEDYPYHRLPQIRSWPEGRRNRGIRRPTDSSDDELPPGITITSAPAQASGGRNRGIRNGYTKPSTSRRSRYQMN